MAYETLIVEIEDYVSLIRLNRPDAMNALNSTLMRELAAAVSAALRRRSSARRMFRDIFSSTKKARSLR